MGDGGIGRPGYSTETARRAGPMRPLPPGGPPEYRGAFRFRAAASVACALYAWAWVLGWVAMPMWTTLVVAALGVRSARWSMDPDASDVSLLTGRAGQVAGGLYLAYSGSVLVELWAVQHAGVATLLTTLLTS